ncbi:MAG: Gfo/Idh/MocA family oxidoreductase [Rhodobacterales bacterium]|nr:Gfo/Idh/MocA family oxidoreductase [Rhodobacterales bacterium]
MSLRSPMSRKLRLGLVGGGRGGYIGAVHRTAATLDGHWEVVAGALSRNIDVCRASAADWGIPSERAYPDFRAMIAAEPARPDAIDAVAICTTNETHFEIAAACLNAGFHVMCEKPLTLDPTEAWALVDLARTHNAVFAVGHCYSGYPMIRQARAMIARGELGKIRSVVTEYASQYGVEQNYTMPWLDDPERSGPSGVVAGTGTHALHLTEFVTGLRVVELSADLTALVPGHVLEDHATMHLRFDGGARGMLWNTSVALGNENGLSIRVYGETGGLHWRQENPTVLEHFPLKSARRTLTCGGFDTDAASGDWTRLPYGHPEGYQEAYANLYVEFGQAILNGTRSGHLFPTVEDGARGVDFVHAALKSSGQNAAFVPMPAAAKK